MPGHFIQPIVIQFDTVAEYDEVVAELAAGSLPDVTNVVYHPDTRTLELTYSSVVT